MTGTTHGNAASTTNLRAWEIGFNSDGGLPVQGKQMQQQKYFNQQKQSFDTIQQVHKLQSLQNELSMNQRYVGQKEQG